MEEREQPMTPGHTPGQLTEDQLVHGWASAPETTMRLARPADMTAVRELVTLAGIDLEQELVAAVVDGTAAGALRAGLHGGCAAFSRDMAEEFFRNQDHDQLRSYLRASLPLVAEHQEHGIVGALIAYPPPRVAADHLAHTEHLSPDERIKILLGGGIGLAKIKALATAEHARGQHIASSLLTCCVQLYLHCGYQVIYGQMPPTPGLDTFYTRHGFDVLAPGEGLDLWVVFGVHSCIYPDPGERTFVLRRHRQ
jgi:hypothetical protein